MEVATLIKVPKRWGLSTFELWVIHGDRGVVGGQHTLSREDRAFVEGDREGLGIDK